MYAKMYERLQSPKNEICKPKIWEELKVTFQLSTSKCCTLSRTCVLSLGRH